MEKREARSGTKVEMGRKGRQSDVASTLKCSSRDPTLEFAGNRTGLLGGGCCVCVYISVCVCWGQGSVPLSDVTVGAVAVQT